MIEPRHVVVIGGGVAGLVAALDCARVGIRVTVVEARSEWGGAVATADVAGVRLDVGAESYATRGGTVRELVESLGLAEKIITPHPAGAWLRRSDGRSVPMPRTGILGIPANPLADDVRAVIGWGGAVRAYLDRIRPVLTLGRETNLGELVHKRMGAAVLRELVAPVTRGVYSVDPDLLDVDLAAPGLNSALTTTGSLSGAVASLRSAAVAGSRVEGLEGGMFTLIEALLAEIIRRGGTLIADAPLARLERSESSGWTLGLGDEAETELECDEVILALPESAARSVLAPLIPLPEDPLGADTAVEILTLVVDCPALDSHPRGSGVLTAEAQAGLPEALRVGAKALTHSSAKWGWLATELSEYPGRHALRLSYSLADSDAGDPDLPERARLDAEKILGVEIPAARVLGHHRYRWHNTAPSAQRDLRSRAEKLRAEIATLPALEITGAWLSGTGLASVIPDALAASGRSRRRIAASYLTSGELDDALTVPAVSSPDTSDPSPTGSTTSKEQS